MLHSYGIDAFAQWFEWEVSRVVVDYPAKKELPDTVAQFDQHWSCPMSW